MIFFAAILFATAASAQMDAHFGIKGGMNASELHSTNNGGNKMDTKIGFHAGVLAHIHAKHSNWGIQPEVMYSLEGAKQTVAGIKTDYNMGYINKEQLETEAKKLVKSGYGQYLLNLIKK